MNNKITTRKKCALVILFVFALLSGFLKTDAQVSKEFETRCGWYDNPTPGNYWLSDKDDEWIIGVQGGYQLENFAAPSFKKNQWVDYFGGSYGYGCALTRKPNAFWKSKAPTPDRFRRAATTRI